MNPRDHGTTNDGSDDEPQERDTGGPENPARNRDSEARGEPRGGAPDDGAVPDEAPVPPEETSTKHGRAGLTRSEQRAVDALLERETPYGLLQRGRALMGRRHYAQAAVLLQRAAGLEPRRGSILEALGRAYYNSGQHERAAATFEDLLEIDPSLPYAHFALGQSLKQLGRQDEARTHLRLAVALAPESRLYRNALDRLEGNRPPTLL